MKIVEGNKANVISRIVIGLVFTLIAVSFFVLYQIGGNTPSVETTAISVAPETSRQTQQFIQSLRESLLLSEGYSEVSATESELNYLFGIMSRISSKNLNYDDSIVCLSSCF